MEVTEVTIETLSGGSFSFEPPQEEIYRDEEDYNVGEIYQGYSYSKESTGEYVADLYFGMAAELNCDSSPENALKVYEKQHGAAVQFEVTRTEHPVFERRIEFRNAVMHRIVYLNVIDEFELFSCELLLKAHLAEKELHEKILNDFERMVNSCRAETPAE